MKILYFMNHADKGGAALALIDLISEIKKNHPELQLIVITGKRNDLNRKMDRLGIENYSVPFKNFVSSKHYPIFLWRILLRLRHDIMLPLAIHLLSHKVDLSTVDIIHTNLNRIDIGVFFAAQYGIPHIWHLREHREGDFEKISIYKNDIEYMNSFCSYYIAISKSVYQEWVKAGIPEEKIHLIYDGVDETKIKNRKNYCSWKENKVIKMIFLGGYDPAKGQEQLIRAVALLEDRVKRKCQVDFYGNGQKSYKNYLEKLVKQFNLESIVSIYAYDANIYSRLSEYDVGINCSRKEGFGRVTVEYMLSGLCVVATDSGANKELIQNGETGLLYPYGDVRYLSKLLNNILNSHDIIPEMGKNAKNVACRNFTLRDHENKVVSLYSDIVKP